MFCNSPTLQQCVLIHFKLPIASVYANLLAASEEITISIVYFNTKEKKINSKFETINQTV